MRRIIALSVLALPLTALAAMAVGGQDDLPPLCIINVPPIVECQGNETLVVLDASGSFDPEGRPLRFEWDSCPDSSIKDPFVAITTLSINTSDSCAKTCSIRLALFDGMNRLVCRFDIEVIPMSPDLPELDLDIKPGSCPNPINAGANGVVPVSLLGTGSFDVSDVDVSSLVLRRTDLVGSAITPIQNTIEDTGTPFTGDGCDCHAMTGDGIDDLSLKFDKNALSNAFLLANEPEFSFLELELAGNLNNGDAFVARDCIRVQ